MSNPFATCGEWHCFQIVQIKDVLDKIEITNLIYTFV